MHLQPLNTLSLLAAVAVLQTGGKPLVKVAGVLEATGHRQVFPFLVGSDTPSQ